MGHIPLGPTAHSQKIGTGEPPLMGLPKAFLVMSLLRIERVLACPHTSCLHLIGIEMLIMRVSILIDWLMSLRARLVMVQWWRESSAFASSPVLFIHYRIHC
jgi:hypothetical protein